MAENTNEKVEYWDLIDRKGKFVQRMRRGEGFVPPGLYHATVEIVATDMAGHILVTQRDPMKNHDAGKWEFPAGSVISGETVQRAAIRELFEETGLKPAKLSKIQEKWVPGHRPWLPGMVRVAYLAYIPTLLDEKIILQEGETCGYRFITISEWYTMIRQGVFAENRIALYEEHFYATLEKAVGELNPSAAPADAQAPAKKKIVKKNFGVMVPSKQEDEDDLRI